MISCGAVCDPGVAIQSFWHHLWWIASRNCYKTKRYKGAQSGRVIVDNKTTPLDKTVSVYAGTGGEFLAMLKKTMLASAVLALSVAPVAAQAAEAAAMRASADVQQSEQLSTTAWIVGAIGLGLLIWGIIELTDDDAPESP